MVISFAPTTPLMFLTIDEQRLRLAWIVHIKWQSRVPKSFSRPLPVFGDKGALETRCTASAGAPCGLHRFG